MRTLPVTRVFKFTEEGTGKERSVYLKKIQVAPDKRPDIWKKQSPESKEALRRMGVYAGSCGTTLFIYRKER